jgi:hypothetical protein
MRVHTIPMLLNRLARSEKHLRRTPMGLRDVIGIVTRLCNFRPFCSRFFPKVCKRQLEAAARRTLQKDSASTSAYQLTICKKFKKERRRKGCPARRSLPARYTSLLAVNLKKRSRRGRSDLWGQGGPRALARAFTAFAGVQSEPPWIPLRPAQCGERSRATAKSMRE